MIGSDHGSGAGHVLRNDLRLTRNILAHVSREEAGPAIVEPTRRGAHHNTNCLSLIKRVGLCPAWGDELRSGKKKREADQEKRSLLHDTSIRRISRKTKNTKSSYALACPR